MCRCSQRFDEIIPRAGGADGERDGCWCVEQSTYRVVHRTITSNDHEGPRASRAGFTRDSALIPSMTRVFTPDGASGLERGGYLLTPFCPTAAPRLRIDEQADRGRPVHGIAAALAMAVPSSV